MQIHTILEENMNDPEEIKEPEHSFKDIFKNKLRFQMWGLFSMYPELSLSDLSQKLGKSKSTIHPHLKLLLEIGLIQEVREQKVRGNIHAKIYALKQGYDKKIANMGKSKKCLTTGVIDKEMGAKMIEGNLLQTQLQIEILQTREKFYQKLRDSGIEGPDERALQVLNEMYKIEDLDGECNFKYKENLTIYGYFSPESYLEVKRLQMEFFDAINAITQVEEGKEPNIEKPFYFFELGIPLKRMLEYLNPSK